VNKINKETTKLQTTICCTRLHECCSKALFVLKNFLFRHSDSAQRNKEKRKEGK
jgi:hypothetical protein